MSLPVYAPSRVPSASNMVNKNLTGHDLMELGFPAGRSISLAISVMQKHYSHLTTADQLEVLKQALLTPDKFVTHTVLGEIITALAKHHPGIGEVRLHEQPQPYAVFGDSLIEADAKEQMNLAMRLPVTVHGALMPDTHKGHGLPIGGVLATQGVVIPYAVGMDIACRMHFTLYPVPATVLEQKKPQLKQLLQDQTRFGVNTGFEKPREHAVFDRPEFNQIKILQQLKMRAAHQLGSSGTGNHFVEFGAVTLNASQNSFDLGPCAVPCRTGRPPWPTVFLRQPCPVVLSGAKQKGGNRRRKRAFLHQTCASSPAGDHPGVFGGQVIRYNHGLPSHQIMATASLTACVGPPGRARACPRFCIYK